MNSIGIRAGQSSPASSFRYSCKIAVFFKLVHVSSEGLTSSSHFIKKRNELGFARDPLCERIRSIVCS